MFSYEYIWKPVSMTQVSAYLFNLDLCNLNHFKQTIFIYVFPGISQVLRCIKLSKYMCIK